MAVWILQFIPGDIPTPPFEPTAHVGKVQLFLAAAPVLLYVWSSIRLLRSRRRR